MLGMNPEYDFAPKTISAIQVSYKSGMGTCYLCSGWELPAQANTLDSGRQAERLFFEHCREVESEAAMASKVKPTVD
ncbi:hypothetical protein R6Q59_006447 [Mikania micrantha]